MHVGQCIDTALHSLRPSLPFLTPAKLSLLCPLQNKQLPQVVSRLRHVLDSHRHRALGLSSRQPGTMARSLRVGGGPAHDFILPFREETDSRHHFRFVRATQLYIKLSLLFLARLMGYATFFCLRLFVRFCSCRTADQGRMYSNREASRDSFLRLLRTHQVRALATA